MKEPNKYEITRLSDIYEFINLENIDNFLVDLKMWLLHVNLFKESNNGTLEGIKFSPWIWIDDGKNDFDLTLTNEEGDYNCMLEGGKEACPFASKDHLSCVVLRNCKFAKTEKQENED